MTVRTRGICAAFAVSTAFLMVFVAGSAAAAPPAPATASGSSSSWAYGAVRSLSLGGNLTYEKTATFGYTVVLNESAAVGETIPLVVTRTMGADITLRFCSPNCKSPLEVYSATFHEWETSTTYANFTLDATVNESGTAVPALGLNDSSTLDLAFVRDSAQTVVGGTILHSHFLSVNATAQSSVAFAQPLGLYPMNLTQSTTWTSGSAFSAAGSYGVNWYYGSDMGGSGRFSSNGSVARSGNVSVAGEFNGTDVTFGGVTFPAIQLTITGPFNVREGFILVPSAADLFGSTAQSWSADGSSTAATVLGSLDARGIYQGHIGIAASEWVWNSASTTSQSAALPRGSGPTTAVTPLTAVGNQPVVVQGSPESVNSANGEQSCLVSGVGCPSSSGAGLNHPWFGVLLVGAVVLVAVVVAIVLVTERRRLPPPTYPNAGLYPPGVARGPAGTTPTSPPAAEDDPLDHLW